MIWTTTRRVTRLPLERHCRAFSSHSSGQLAFQPARDAGAYVQRLIPFSARPNGQRTWGSRPFSFPRRFARSRLYFHVRNVRVHFPSDLRAIYKYRRTSACANQWGILRTRACVWCLCGCEDAGIYTTCLPLKSFGVAGIRRFNNSQNLFSYDYDARLGLTPVEKVFIHDFFPLRM